MKSILNVILICIFSTSVFAQNCACPKESILSGTGNPLKTFLLGDHKKIGLCGYQDKEIGSDIYNEFAVFECGQTKPLAEWGAVQSCKVSQHGDTLIVGEIAGLYVGTNFGVKWIPFYTHKFFYNGSQLKHIAYYRKDIQKYTSKQINEIVARYKQLKKGNYEHTIEIANMLLWGYVSGSKQCEVYLNTIEKKFGPFDGHIAEEWHSIVATYLHWTDKNHE